MAEIAVIGMACLFPGAPDLDSYWHNILNGVDAVTEPPPEAWDPKLHYDPTGADPDKVYCQRGGYISPLAYFDPLEHGIPPIAVGGEPDQWLALKLARDALLDAGYPTLDEQVRLRTAVILGKGTYLNTGNLTAVQHGLMVAQTLDVLRSLHPEYTATELQQIQHELTSRIQPISAETVPGLIPNIIVGRIANRLDLMGPSHTVDAACASSLIAVQLALNELESGGCDLALVGGSQVTTPVPTLNVFCKMGALSRREQIRPFDKDADGTLLGEGIGIVVLKRAADAERDGDRVYALIKGVGVASDGRGVSVMAPRIEGEELALRRAYTAAGVEPASIGLIEAHGTGTPVGDVVEVQALAKVFGGRDGHVPRVALGSVKSMISHTMPAAGIAGLMKTALALHHKILPPTLNITEPNPKLELERTPFYLNTETRPWIHDSSEPRRAAVNAFGFGGINAHMVMQEHRPAADAAVRYEAAHSPPWDSEVCIVAAPSREGLVAQAEQLVAFLTKQPETPGRASFQLVDLAASLSQAATGVAGGVRLSIVASSLEDLRTKLSTAVTRLHKPETKQIKDNAGIYYFAEPLAAGDAKVAVLFPGEGSQYPNMLADLCIRIPEVRAIFDQTDRVFADQQRWARPSEVLFPPPLLPQAERDELQDRLWQIEGAIEAVLSANQALWMLATRLGVQPDMVVGHSTGEYSAMRAAGLLDLSAEPALAHFAISLNEAYRRTGARGGVPNAAMLAVGAPRERVEEIVRAVGDGLFIGMDNCPHQAVIVGERTAVERARDLADRDNLIYEFLAFERAYHTPLFGPYAEHLAAVFDDFELGRARTPLYSCTTAAPYPSDQAQVRALMVEHWTAPVEFRKTIETLYDDGVRLFLEVGPRGNLSAFVEDCLRGKKFCAAPMNVQRRSGVTQLNHWVGLLIAHGLQLDPAVLFATRTTGGVDWHTEPKTVTLASRAMKLRTGVEMMSIAPHLAERLRPRASHVAAAAEEVSATPTHQVQPEQVPAPSALPSAPPSARPAASSEGVAEEAEAARPAEPIAGPPATSWAADGVAAHFDIEVDGVSTAMQGYLDTIDHFLAVQTDVLQAYLGAGERAADYEVRFPLLGTIHSWQAGEHLVADRTFDLEHDLFLRDHTLGRVTSQSDPELCAMPVMPLTLSLELAAEAAAYLSPDQVIVQVSNLRAHRWIAFESGSQTLRVSARRLPDAGCRVAVDIRNITEDAINGPVTTPVLEAIVELADDYPAPPAQRPLRRAGGGRSRLTPEMLYRDIMFHGPSWQGVETIDESGPGHILARLEVLSFSSLLASTPCPRFELDPITLDAAGQLVGFWTAEQLPSGHVVFPYKLDALDIFGALRPVGESIQCLAGIDLLGQLQTRTDFDLVDGYGRLWMRLTGWEDRRFDSPGGFAHLIPATSSVELTDSWPEAVVGIQNRVVECRRFSADLGTEGGFWKRIWAGCVLSRRERAVFNALSTPERHQLGWLASRTAAKEAVRALVRRTYGLEPALVDVEIQANERGQAVIGGAWAADLPFAPLIALSHTDTVGAAVATLAHPDGQSLLGLNLVSLDRDGAGLEEMNVSPAVRQLLSRATPAADDREWLMRAWCATGAVGKALGVSLLEGPTGVVIDDLDMSTGIVQLRLQGELARAFGDRTDGQLEVRTWRSQQLVGAICSTREEDGAHDNTHAITATH